jgi:anti-anti-sigma regulatory factor
MGTERLAVEFERRLDGSVLLRLRGKLERGTAALLDGVLQALWDDPSPVIVDLSYVDQIDSRGLDVLLAAESGAHRRSSPVEVFGIRESLRAHRPPVE